MDASAEVSGSSSRFAELSHWLNAKGFSAPQVLAADLSAELLLVEDFGDQLFVRLFERDISREMELYAAAAEFLFALQRHDRAPGLSVLDGPALGTLTKLFDEWYVPAISATMVPEQTPISHLIEELYRNLAGEDALVTSLRDFHAENVIWLPDRRGPARLGLLDFQDAVAAHPIYDLVSLLQDARRDLLPGTEAAVFALFCQRSGRDPVDLTPIYALIGAQRALRILGVFARLVLQSGKPRYAVLMPRVWRHLTSNLTHPALSRLAEAVHGSAREPTPRRLAELVAKCPSA